MKTRLKKCMEQYFGAGAKQEDFSREYLFSCSSKEVEK